MWRVVDPKLLQWNPSTMDTLGTASSVLIKEVSSFQGLFNTLFYAAGTMHGVLIKGDVLISGVSLQRGSTV